MGYYDENGEYIPGEDDLKPIKPYTAEQIAEREEWTRRMSELIEGLCTLCFGEE